MILISQTYNTNHSDLKSIRKDFIFIEKNQYYQQNNCYLSQKTNKIFKANQQNENSKNYQ